MWLFLLENTRVYSVRSAQKYRIDLKGTKSGYKQTRDLMSVSSGRERETKFYLTVQNYYDCKLYWVKKVPKGFVYPTLRIERRERPFNLISARLIGGLRFTKRNGLDVVCY